MIFNRRRTNLHHIWDTTLVSALGRNARATTSRLEAEIASNKARSWEADSARTWANESFHIASSRIYDDALRIPTNQAPLIRRLHRKDGSAGSSICL